MLVEESSGKQSLQMMEVKISLHAAKGQADKKTNT